MNDPYDQGIPKYSSAQEIYDSLCELVQTEEMSILTEIGVDVSYDQQGYYYTDRGFQLKEKFEELSECGRKMWIMDLAVMRIDQTEIHDVVYSAMADCDLAKRIGFKKLFIDQMLRGDKTDYDEIVDDYLCEVQELNRFDNWNMWTAFKIAMDGRGLTSSRNQYDEFACKLYDKVQGLKLSNEIELIIASRSHLTAYDDFILGLKMNQALYERQEFQYLAKVALLQESYQAKIDQLYIAADKVGILPAFKELLLIDSGADGQ
ncbi:MAG: hypothetical protein CVU92_04715 [Firmicutes bacterium HGW-Firmicutes-17]|jgi:hypothetical protein|nr:MAG: hypothetical protein CVU92_04715 [Firmicutes bacterium HGW-Firmicutes-17]